MENLASKIEQPSMLMSLKNQLKDVMVEFREINLKLERISDRLMPQIKGDTNDAEKTPIPEGILNEIDYIHTGLRQEITKYRTLTNRLSDIL